MKKYKKTSSKKPDSMEDKMEHMKKKCKKCKGKTPFHKAMGR